MNPLINSPECASRGISARVDQRRREGGTRAAAVVAVDRTRCDGHGLCAALRPDHFALDEWGFPIVRDDPLTGDDLRDLRRVVATCPALALRLERPDPERTSR